MATSSTDKTNPISSFPLKDRVAIVTGASRGIGRAIALHLASLGAKLVINYTSNKVQADPVATEINSSFPGSTPRALTVQADVSDPSQVKSLFDIAEQFFNLQPYILVNSAGVSIDKSTPVANTSVEDFDRVFSVNTRGAFLCAKEAANRLKRGGGGRIILISSSIVASLRPGNATYAASKAAVDAMVKILAKELGLQQIVCHQGQLEQICTLQVRPRKWCKEQLMSAHMVGLARARMLLPLLGS